jgi:DNA-binding CsgD family transcriptional regulator
VNREQKLRKLIPGASAELIAALAVKPAAEVDLTVAALRQARRDALDHDKAVRRQRRKDAQAFHWYDESELSDRNVRMLASTGRRAATNLDALRSLADFRQHTESLMCTAVAGLRAQGIPDEEIGGALGITRQAVGQHFGRKQAFTADGMESPEDGDA